MLNSFKHYIRLNLSDVKNLPDMLVKKSWEFYKVKIVNPIIKLRYDDVSNYWGCPIDGVTNWGGRKIGLPINYKGYIGTIQMTVDASESEYKPGPKQWQPSACEFLFNNWSNKVGFIGFHSGTGCPGNVFGEYKVDIGFYFFLQDFPKLQKINTLNSFKVNV